MTPQQRFDVVVYRMESAKRLLVEIESHIDDGYYNTAINRMYYACFYAVSALLIHAYSGAYPFRNPGLYSASKSARTGSF